jgi:hypothetical protein
MKHHIKNKPVECSLDYDLEEGFKQGFRELPKEDYPFQPNYTYGYEKGKALAKEAEQVTLYDLYLLAREIPNIKSNYIRILNGKEVYIEKYQNKHFYYKGDLIEEMYFKQGPDEWHIATYKRDWYTIEYNDFCGRVGNTNIYENFINPAFNLGFEKYTVKIV